MFSTADLILGPVVAWRKTITRILTTIPNATKETTVCSFGERGIVTEITGEVSRTRLKVIVNLIGEPTLGFNEDAVGLHSIRAGGAMAMFLSGTSEIIIQRVGRWSSFAFLEYIREQVDCFTLGVSQKMLQFENFHHFSEREANNQQAEATSTQNEDGPESINFNIRFSKMVLYDNKINDRRR